MNKYLLEKDYSLLHPLNARDELRQLRLDLIHLEGFGTVRLSPVFYELRNRYELSSSNRLLDGHFHVRYFVKDVVRCEVRIPRSVTLDFSAQIMTDSLSEFLHKYEVAKLAPKVPLFWI